jgi:polysaccharide export outer membrane protein
MKTSFVQIPAPPSFVDCAVCRHFGRRRGVSGLLVSVAIALFLAILRAPAADTQPTAVPQATPPSGPGNQAAASVEKAASSAVESGNGSSKSPLVFSGGIMDALDSKQRLGVGDTVIFQVLEDQEEPKALSVTDGGELHVPELGLVKAAGKTCRQLAYEIKSQLEQTTYYHATVILGIQLLNKTISGRRIYLAGQVRNTGPQEVPAGETWTVSRAIMGAGGFTDYADKKQVKLVRGGAKGSPGKTYIVNIVDVWEKGQTEKDISVEPEDLIYVPARAVNF